MGRHFLSVLGTGNYSKAKYTCGENGVTTSYVQEAILKLKMQEFTKEDHISIFVTEKAEQCNWHDREWTSRELQNMGNSEIPEKREGLCSILQRECVIKDEERIPIEKVIIPMGASEKELWKIFNVIYDEIQERDELYVDITHSLRNIPVQMLSVIAYARVVKNVSVAGIYYGAFEAGEKNEDGITEAPIFDLVTFLDILDWSQAANSFVRYGNSDEIRAIYEIQKKKKMNGNMGRLGTVIKNLSNITQGLETSRGCLCSVGKCGKDGQSALKSYQSYMDSYKNMQEENEKAKVQNSDINQIEPLNRLFEVINQKLEVFDVEDNLHFGLAAIDWAIENNKTQQGFTALDETIKTYLCIHYHLDEFYERYREGICKTICNLICRKKQAKHIKAVDDFTEEFRKEVYQQWESLWEERWKNNNYKKKDSNTMTLEEEKEIAHCMIMELPCELAELSQNISNRRNSMNHFAYSNLGEFGCEGLYGDLKKYNKEFRDIIAKMEGCGEE